MNLKKVWRYSEKWNIAVKPQKVRSTANMASGAIESTKKGVLTLNPFGTNVKMPKLNLPSDEFITYSYGTPLQKLLKNIK